jgi:hypothetical protein
MRGGVLLIQAALTQFTPRGNRPIFYHSEIFLGEFGLPERKRQETLETFWAKERQIEPLTVEITAAEGRKATGGQWTRPDLVSLAVWIYRYLPGKYVEVGTFEVKPSDAIAVTAVYETLAHLRSATHAYVIFHVPDEEAESVQ